MYQGDSRRSSVSTTDIVASTPHTIVLSDPDGNVSPISLPSQSIYDVDTSRLPPGPPLHTVTSGDPSSSPSSVSLTELMGGSPRRRRTSRALTITDNTSFGTGSPAPSPRPGGSLQLRNMLQRRADKIRDSTALLVCETIVKLEE